MRPSISSSRCLLRRLSALAIVGAAIVVGACDSRALSAAGGSCERSSDCDVGFVCVNRVCSTDIQQIDGGTTPNLTPQDASEADVPTDATTDATTDGAPDATSGDTTTTDTAATDAATTDIGPADTGPADTGPADTGPIDTGVADSLVVDTGPADTGASEAAGETAVDAALE